MDDITNLDEPTDMSDRQLLHSTRSRTPFCLKNLLSLPKLHVRKTHRKRPLVDYNQCHVVTSDEYLQIMHKITMDRDILKITKEQRRREKEENKAKTCSKVTYYYKQNS